MIEHVVLLKLKESATEPQTRNMIEKILALKNHIPEIISITAGINITSRSKGFHCGVVVRLNDFEAIDTYRFHPKHVDVLENAICPILEDIIAVDYPC